MNDARIISKRYIVGAKIGEGGMGAVYRAIDAETDIPVAIKELKQDALSTTPELVERFLREAEVLRRLKHPHIVTILDAFQERDDYYIVMECLGGGNLKDRLRHARYLPIEEVLHIGQALADALTCAHEHNIVHRDLKPSNVLLDSDGNPYLSDFGVAYLGDATRVTHIGSLVGTLGYLSPEACIGELTDERGDIWSLGVMLYELLTGRRPFVAKTTGALITTILNQAAPDIHALRPDVPEDLAALIRAMLIKDRNRRIDSATKVAEALRQIEAGESLPTDVRQLLTADDTAQSRAMFGFPVKSSNGYKPNGKFSIFGQHHDNHIITRPDWTLSGVRPLKGKPRIFITYRPEDSAAITERLYSRFSAAFGVDRVFKGLEANGDTSEDYKIRLAQHVIACDIQLVIIGRRWARTLKQYSEDAIDNVRLAIEAGLQTPRQIIIPVLVDGATMPEELPDPIKALKHLKQAIIRDDPDFNRDAQWLIDQINRFFKLPLPKRKRPIRRTLIMLSATLMVYMALRLWIFSAL